MSTAATSVPSPIFMMQDEYLPDLFVCSIFHQEPHWGRCEPSATTRTADKEHLSEKFIPEKNKNPRVANLALRGDGAGVKGI